MSFIAGSHVTSSLPPIQAPLVDIFTFIKGRFLQHPDDVLFTCVTSSSSHSPNDTLGRGFTAKDIVHLTECVASGLRKRGFEKGDTICMISSFCLESIVVCYATFALGGVFCPISTSLNVDDIVVQVGVSNAKILGCSRSFFETASAIFEKASTITSLLLLNGSVESLDKDAFRFADLAKDSGDAFKDPPADINVKEDLALILFSTGTTGQPKAIGKTHYNVVFSQSQGFCGAFNQINPGEGTLGQGAIANESGLCLTAIQFPLQRANVFVVSSFDIRRDLAGLINLCNLQHVFLPTCYLKVITKGLNPEPKYSHLHTVLTGGAIVSSTVEQAFVAATGITDFRQVYTLTETGFATFAPKDASRKKWGSVGVLAPNVEMKIIDVHTEADLPPTSEGEICLRSDGLMKGYIGEPEEVTSAVLSADGWFRTGDVGRFDEDGYLYIKERKLIGRCSD